MGSKREGEYLTKEDGQQKRFNSAVEDQAKMYTPGSNTRKIAKPYSRKYKPSANNTTLPAPTNVFGNLNANLNGFQQQPQLTFGGVNGVTFGSALTNSADNSAAGGGFTFQAPTTLSFGSTDAAVPNNPFANLNGGGGNLQSNAQSEDAMMESPQKQQNLGLSFSGNGGSVSSSTPFSFGQPQQNGSVIFGASQTTSAPSNSMSAFEGSSKPSSTFQSSGLFGRISQPDESPATSTPANGTIFGFSQANQTPSIGLFGQQSQIPSTQSKSFSFGQTTGSQSISQSPKQSQSFTFGQNESKTVASSLNPSKADEPKTSPFLFGQPTTTSVPTTSLFGQTVPAQNPSYNLFGQSTSSQMGGQASQSSNLFGGFSQAATPAKTQAALSATTEGSSGLFNFAASQQTPQATFGTTNQNPGQTATVEEAGKTQVTQGLESQASTTSFTGFNFKPNPVGRSSTSGSIFGNSKPETETSGPKSTDLFNLIPQPTQNDGQSMSQKASKSDETPSGKQSLFGSTLSTSKPDDASPAKQPIWGASGLFNTPSLLTAAQPPQTAPSPGVTLPSSNAPSKNASDLFKPQTSQPAAETSKTISSTANAAPPVQIKPSTLFSGEVNATRAKSNAQPAVSNSGTSLIGSASSGSVGHLLSKPDPQVDDAEKEKANIRSRTNGPGYIPRSFDNDKRAEHDKTYRLTSLDYGFARRMGTMDFRKHDFSIIVRGYIAARESIGQPIGGLYERAIAGSKRKSDHENQDRDDPPQSKKAKADYSNSERNSSSSQASSTSLQEQPSSNTASVFQDLIAAPSASTKASTDDGPTPALGKSASSVQPAASFGFGTGFKPSLSQPPKEAATASNPFSSIGKIGPAKETAPASNPFVSTGKTTEFASSGFTPAMPSTTPTKSPPKKLGFQVSNLGGGETPNFMESFAKQSAASVAKMMEKRKAEEFDSDEDTEAEYEAKVQAEQRAKKAKLASIGQTGFKPSFGGAEALKTPQATSSLAKEVPKPASPKQPFSLAAFGMSSSGQPPKASAFVFGSKSESNSTNAIGSSAEPSTDEDSRSGEDEENDNEEDLDGEDDPDYDHAENDGEDSEEAGESEGHFADESAEDSAEDIQAAIEASRQNKGKSLFERITKSSTGTTPLTGTTPEPQILNGTANLHQKKSVSENSTIVQVAPNNSFKGFPVGSNIFQSTPTAPAISPFTPVNGLEVPKQPIELAKTFNFTPTPSTTTPTPVPGASVLFGGTTKTNHIPGEGLFGSRPSTPNNADASTTASLFSSLAKNSTSSPRVDNTWKPGNSIKFGTPEKTSEGPIVNVTVATPPAKEENNAPKTFSSLFGGSPASGSSSASTSGNNLGFSFGAPAPGFLGAASHLLPSANSSAVSSRATSPGATDNESVATNESEDLPNDPQTSLMSSRVGEEDEQVLYEGRSKALKLVDPEAPYQTMGLGEVRILKNHETGKTRILFRAEPSSNIIINSNLNAKVSYTTSSSGGSGIVRFPIFTNEGVEKWVVKVKTKEMADELAAIMEENKF